MKMIVSFKEENSKSIKKYNDRTAYSKDDIVYIISGFGLKLFLCTVEKSIDAIDDRKQWTQIYLNSDNNVN